MTATNKLRDEAAEELTNLWEEACKLLKGLRCPRAAYHHVEKDGPCLSWEKFDGVWRILYNDRKLPSVKKPIQQCNLQIRIEMVQHFLYLKGAVLEVIDQAIPELDHAITSFKAILGKSDDAD